MEIRSNRWVDRLSRVASGDNVGSEFGAFQPVDELFWAESPQVAQSICVIGQGLKKIGDGLASLVPHKSSPPERSQFYPPGAVKKQEEKKSFFDRLFKPKEQPKKIESVYDWMGQEQVLP
ncbi:MAG: hypothetical protein KatS3mg112_0973 [Thermogutta sp.]|nr:MAG: hypothetical protein KatS3mg112_0973 [Thermogutta sp.]